MEKAKTIDVGANSDAPVAFVVKEETQDTGDNNRPREAALSPPRKTFTGPIVVALVLVVVVIILAVVLTGNNDKDDSVYPYDDGSYWSQGNVKIESYTVWLCVRRS